MRSIAALTILAALVLGPGATHGPRLGLGSPRGPVGLAGAIAAGIAIDVACALAAHLVGGGLRAFLVFWALVTAAGIARRAGKDEPHPPDLPWTRSCAMVLLLAAALGLASGGQLGLNSDAWMHLGWIHRLVVRDGILPAFADGQRPLNGGVWWFLVAAACRLTGATPLELWDLLPTLLAPAIVLGAIAVGRALSRRGTDAIAIGAGFLVVLEGTYVNPIRELAYPRYVAWLPLMGALATTLRFARSGGSRRPAAVALMLAGAAGIHAFEPIVFALMTCGTALYLAICGEWPWCPRPRRLLTAAFSGLIPAALTIFALHWGSARIASARTSAMLAQGAISGVIQIPGLGFFLDPRGSFTHTLGLAGLLAMVLVLIAPQIAPGQVSRGFLIGAAMLPPFIAWNPFALPVFTQLIRVPAVLDRLSLGSSVPFLVPLLVTRLTARKHPWPCAVRLTVLGLLVLALLPNVSMRLASIAEHHRQLGQQVALEPLEAEIALMDATLSDPARVLTDPLSGLLAFGLSVHEPIDWGSSRRAGLEDRLEPSPALDLFRKPWKTSGEIKRRLVEGHVRFVMLLHSPPFWTQQFESFWAPYVDASTRTVLRHNPQVFHPLARTPQADLYTIDAEDHSGPITGKDEPIRDAISTLAPAEPSSTPNSIAATPDLGLVLARWSPAEVPAGGQTTLHIIWRALRASRLIARVQVVLLHSAFGQATGGIGATRPARWLREILDQRAYRFGTQADIVPPQLIGIPVPGGTLFAQDIAFSVPTDAGTGVYRAALDALPMDQMRPTILTLGDAFSPASVLIPVLAVTPGPHASTS